MRSNLVEPSSEVFDQDLRIDSILEPLHRQALIAELAVEAFMQSVLPGLARVDQRGLDVLAPEPAQDGARAHRLRSLRNHTLCESTRCRELRRLLGRAGPHVPLLARTCSRCDQSY